MTSEQRYKLWISNNHYTSFRYTTVCERTTYLPPLVLLKTPSILSRTHKVNYTSSVFIIKYPFTFSPFHPFTLKYLSALSPFSPFTFPPFHPFTLKYLSILSSFPLFTFPSFHFFTLSPLNILSSFLLSTFPSFHFFTLSPLNTLSPFIAWLGLKPFIRNNVPSCQN